MSLFFPYSIEEVLPALAPDLSYQGINVAEAGIAMLAYREMRAAEESESVAEIWRDLLAYWELETMAMVMILNELPIFFSPLPHAHKWVAANKTTIRRTSCRD